MQGFSVPYIAIASKSVIPSETALNIAVRSAQTVSEYDEFSMLQPVNIFPSDERSAEPTLKEEYGEYDFSEALTAVS